MSVVTDQPALPGLERPSARPAEPQPTHIVELLAEMDISERCARLMVAHGQVRIDGEPVQADAVIDPATARGKFLEVDGRGQRRLFGLPTV